jgi:hypothetical protein
MPTTKTYPKNRSVTKPWIQNALSTELLYGDGPPDWRKATSQSEAVQERLKAVHFLSKHAFVNAELKDIADTLKFCSPRDRCHSAACPECGRAMQRYFVAQCLPLLTGEKACVASVIDSKMSGRAELLHFSATSLINRVKSLLKRNGARLAVGGIDFSFNQNGIGRFRSHWSAHLWLILLNHNRDRWEPALREANLASDAVPRPIKIMHWDGRKEALAYALKTSFKRRVSVYNKATSRRGQQRNTSEQDLRVAERISLYQYLDSIGLHDRVFLLGARPTMTEFGTSIVKLDLRNQ